MDSEAAIEEIVWSITIGGYIQSGVYAMILYEYFITFDDEIRTVWKKPWTLASALLLSVRWNMFVSSILIFVPEDNWASCSVSEYLSAGLDLTSYIQTAVFSALRVYAISERNAPFFVSVLLLGVMPFATNLVCPLMFFSGRYYFYAGLEVCDHQ